MKKIIALFLISCFMLTPVVLTGCSKPENTKEKKEENRQKGVQNAQREGAEG